MSLIFNSLTFTANIKTLNLFACSLSPGLSSSENQCSKSTQVYVKLVAKQTAQVKHKLHTCMNLHPCLDRTLEQSGVNCSCKNGNYMYIAMMELTLKAAATLVHCFGIDITVNVASSAATFFSSWQGHSMKEIRWPLWRLLLIVLTLSSTWSESLFRI